MTQSPQAPNQPEWRVIDFATEPKEYELWRNVPLVERLAAVHLLTQRIYALHDVFAPNFSQLLQSLSAEFYTSTSFLFALPTLAN
jgi:hypothetical protein